MNEPIESTLKEILTKNNIKDSLTEIENEINNLVKLDYIVRVIEFVNELNEMIIDKKFKTNSKVIDLYIRQVNGSFLTCDFLLKDVDTFSEMKRLNVLLGQFSTTSINYFFLEDFGIVLQLEGYTKDKLIHEIGKNMLPDEMKKTIDFVLLENSTNVRESSNVRKPKL